MHLIGNTEKLNLDFTGRVDQLEYRDNPNLDSTDQFYKASLRYSISPQLNLSFRGEFDRDSRPDRELYTSGLALNGARREVSSEGTTADYALTDKTTSSLSYDHGEYWYRSSHFISMTYQASTLSFVHDLSRYINNFSGRLNFGYTQYNFTGLEVNNYETTTGFQYALHEKWTFVLDGGARYTESSFQAGTSSNITQNETSTGTAAIATAKLSYKGRRPVSTSPRAVT